MADRKNHESRMAFEMAQPTIGPSVVETHCVAETYYV
jgi:hypothetical protein